MTVVIAKLWNIATTRNRQYLWEDRAPTFCTNALSADKGGGNSIPTFTFGGESKATESGNRSRKILEILFQTIVAGRGISIGPLGNRRSSFLLNVH